MKNFAAFVTFAAFAVCAASLAGCKKPAPVMPMDKIDYEAQLPPGQLALRKMTNPAQIPDFTPALSNTVGMEQAIANSLDYLRKPSSQSHFPYGPVTHAQAVASMEHFLTLLKSNLTPAQLNRLIARHFDVYISVGCDNKGTVLFTGYYTPIFAGSPVRTDKFKYPLYRAPAGLTKLPDGTPSSPMPDRKMIESTNMFAGNELVWMSDPFEVYVAHIQGSAKLRMPDGKVVTYGYTANNGHDYKSIRTELINDGRISSQAGLQDMIEYFHSHPEDVSNYVGRNPRFVFFAEVPDGRPRGCLNEPVTFLRTVATDKKIFPYACLTFFSTKLPQAQGSDVVDADYSGFAMDQDAGGAIRAAGRCDVYLGVGDDAGRLAGRTHNEGKLYYLFLKPSQMTTPSLTPATAPAPIPAGGN